METHEGNALQARGGGDFISRLGSRCGEMADAKDLKSFGEQSPCGFESRHRYHLLIRRGLTKRWLSRTTKAFTLPRASAVIGQNVIPLPQRSLEPRLAKEVQNHYSF